MMIEITFEIAASKSHPDTIQKLALTLPMSLTGGFNVVDGISVELNNVELLGSLSSGERNGSAMRGPRTEPSPYEK